MTTSDNISAIEAVEKPKNCIQGMVRSIDQYRNCEPKAIADGSYAQVLCALTDDKHDILVLWGFAVSAGERAAAEARKVEALKREIADLREALQKLLWTAECELYDASHARGVYEARALLSKESSEQDGSAISTKGVAE